jgi:hypothetical protein
MPVTPLPWPVLVPRIALEVGETVNPMTPLLMPLSPITPLPFFWKRL